MKTLNVKKTSILVTFPILLTGILWLLEEFNAAGIVTFIFFLASIILSLIYLDIGIVNLFGI
jgi:hypothetical protein